MSIAVISGPPGSGRELEILARFEAALDAEPLLVVPTADDVDRIERELCRRGTGLLGGSVTSFPRLFDAVASAAGIASPPVLSRMQRVWLARCAAAQVPLRQLHRSAAREGFAPALEELLSDLGAAGLDATAFATATEALDDGAYEREIAALLARYEELRDELGMTDEHAAAARATAALRADPACWRERPVLLYGFDDLSRQQIELVDALGRAAEVTVAITYEAERPALEARAELRAVLADELGATIEPELASPAAGSGPGTLHHLERQLFEPVPEAAEPDDSLRLLEGSGHRSEAELIGRTIARLLADGVDPDEVAVTVRSPDRQAPLLARVLSGLGIPVAAEARIPLASTSTGAAVLRLLEIAGGEGTATGVVAFLRGPARARSSSVDWLERRVLRGRMETAEEAIESWRGGEEQDRRIWELDALREAGDDPVAFAAALSRVAASVAERPHERTGVVPSSGPAVELRVTAEIKRALEEAAALGRHAPSPAEAAELLAHVRVPLWRGPTEGRVRILSPYRLRATRLAHLFAAGLSDGTFPARGGADPLLAEERRGALGLAARRGVAAEERYLFYSCVSRPERRLYLSYPVSDEAGTPIPRSPFVEEVRGLLAPAPVSDAEADELEASIAVRSGPEEVVPAPGEASTPRELTRALAAEGSGAAAAGLDLPAGVRESVLADLAEAAEARRTAAEPGPLTHPDVLAALAEDHPYGASTIEEFDTCPYRWFVNHEIKPRPVGPDPEPLVDGGLVHAVLERIYREPPVGSRPEPETVGRWERAATELIRETAAEQGWDLQQANARVRIARFDAVIARFLRRDAETESPLEPRPDLLEASFGERPDDAFEAAELGGFRLHGRIDRIDVADDGRALIRDYKLSAKVTPARKFLDEGKLQMPLYLLAARGFGIDPIGGLYSPLGASREDRPRGMVLKEAEGTLLSSDKEHHYRTDFLEREEFDEILEEARSRAASHVAEIHAGDIGRRPRNGECPRWCDLAPVCRIERGAAVPDPEEEEELAS